MQGFAINNISKNNLKQKGDKIILNLFDKGISAKYKIFGKFIYLETKDQIQSKNLKLEYYNASLSTDKKDEIFNTIANLIETTKEPPNFAIKVNRRGEHKYTSTDLAREVAGAVFDKWPNIKVNLGKPSLEVNIQIINNRSIIYLRN